MIFLENLDNEVLMKRALAEAEQIIAAGAVQQVGGQRPTRGKNGELLAMPGANISSGYYFKRMFEEREADAGRMERMENVWDDPDFLPWELKRNDALRPQIDDAGAPVHLSGIEIPTEAGFRAAKHNAGF